MFDSMNEDTEFSDGPNPVATIDFVNPSTTSFHLECTDKSYCDFVTMIDYAIISKTRLQQTASQSGNTLSKACDYQPSATIMTCTVYQKGGLDDTGGETLTGTISGSQIRAVQATVVEGASLLSSGGGASATSGPLSAAASVTPGAMSTSRGLMMASGSSPAPSLASGATPTVMGTPDVNASAPTAISSGAAAVFGVEGSALLALAGVAAINIL